MAINRASFKSWVSGQTFTARAYVYERGLILDELERIGNVVKGQAVFTGASEPTGVTGDLWFDGP
jgi:hypothetical protein